MSSPMDLFSNPVFQVGIAGLNACLSGIFIASANPAPAIMTGAIAVTLGAVVAGKAMKADEELARLRNSQPEHEQAKPAQTAAPVAP